MHYDFFSYNCYTPSPPILVKVFIFCLNFISLSLYTCSTKILPDDVHRIAETCCASLLKDLKLHHCATDLDSGLAIMDCARYAISVGVPELHIPSHEPFISIRQNFSWTADVLGFVGAEINVTDIQWYKIPDWVLTANQTSKDSDAAAAFVFLLYWDFMYINGSYTIKAQNQVQGGKFGIGLDGSTWIGSIKLTKPTENSNGTTDDVQVNWHIEKPTVYVDGLGELNEAASLLAESTITDTLNNDLLGNLIGDSLKKKLETVWWNTGNIWKLVAWCKNNQ